MNGVIKYFLGCTLILLLGTSDSLSQQQIRKLDDATMEAIENVIENYVWNQNIIGMAVAFIQDGKVAYSHTEGSARTSPDNTPFLISTQSLLASVSKPITAIMAMRLVQEGHLDLDETIDHYIAGYANTTITIRHLLDHQSGISHYSDCPGGYSGEWNAAESIEVVQGCAMCVTPPGGYLVHHFWNNLTWCYH